MSCTLLPALKAVTPTDLLNIAAEALAAASCTCRDLPAGSAWCLACREAERLASLAGLAESPVDVIRQITVSCQDAAVDLGDLLPGITEGTLERGCCTCDDEPCAVCSAGKSLDDLWRELQAA